MKKLFFLFGLFLLTNSIFGQNSSEVVFRDGKKVIKGELICKIKEENRSIFQQKKFTNTDIDRLSDFLKVTSISKKFPRKFPNRQRTNAEGYELVDLSLIYKITYEVDYNEVTAAEMFLLSGMFHYVEAQVVPDLLHVPNDPKVGLQYHLDVIEAFKAWDIQKGDTNVVIGITDTGIDTDHPEVVGRVKRNYNDPIDGIDNDNDGFIDNYFGWDTGENDNDPEVWQHHGNQVTGMCALNTNNGGDVAAIGYNCMLLPVKICNSSGHLVGAYDGIIYAADHGSNVINCSWGGTGSYSQYHQEVIDYATYNKGCVVVAAAGNGNFSSYFYPASYSNVISVGGTDELDKKWVTSANVGSQYNDLVDVCAPAQNVVAMWRGGGSGLIGRGTSFASPIVAGLAGLIKSEYPDASPQKIAAIIKSSTDDIYGVTGNDAYLGQLGTGRINAFKALQPISTPFITYFKHIASDGNEQNFAVGDTVVVDLYLANQLGDAGNLNITVRSSNNYSMMLDSSTVMSSLGRDESKLCDNQLKFVVQASGINSFATFDVEITDGTSTWFDSFSIQVNKDYIDITTNNLDLSFNNYGRIGYTYTGAGIGVDYNGTGSLIKEMGVLLGVSSANVLSYEDYELLTFNAAIVASGEADFTVRGVLDDSWAMSPIGVKIEQFAYAWGSAPNEDYVIYEYIVKNPTSDPMTDIFLGIYGDWDIGNGANNHANYDSGKKLGYVYEEGGMYAGIKALRTKNVNYYAFDHSGTNGIDLTDGFSDDEEFLSMSSGITHQSTSGDVANMISHGPYTIAPGDSITLAFAIVAGNSLSELKSHSQFAENMYESLRGIKIEVENLKNITCKGLDNGEIGVGVDLYFPPYNVSWFHDSTASSPHIDSLPAGNYNVTITDNYGISKNMNFSIVEPEEIDVQLIAAEDVTCFGAKDGHVSLDVSGGNGNYSFNWGLPSIPSIASPDLPKGMYHLEIRDAIGCKDTVEIEIGGPEEIIVQTVWLLDDTATNCKGEASLLATGGVAPYSYYWNGINEVSEDVTGLCKGTYVTEIIDANGCIVEHEVVIDAPEVNHSTDTGSANGVKEIVKDFKLYPNPANEYLIMEFNSLVEEELTLYVLDLNGRLVQEVYADQVDLETYKVILNTTKYHVGNYFIRMTSTSGSSAFKFEVQH